MKNPCLCVEELKRYIKSVEDKREEACVFLSIVLCKLLLPTQSNMPTKQYLGMCSNIDSMKDYNWCIYFVRILERKSVHGKKGKQIHQNSLVLTSVVGK
jgi:hypothetical protein